MLGGFEKGIRGKIVNSKPHMEGEFLDGLSAEGVKVDEPPKRFHDDPNPSIVC